MIRIVKDETGGQPTGTRKMVRCSLATLAKKLDGRISPGTAGRLLRKLGFSSRVNVKRFTGPPHPDRDKQFRHIARQRKKFQRASMPTISVDTKKKELIGDFRNAGRKWGDQPEQVNAHDFPQDAECRAVPYGIYDTSRNEGHVCVGTSADTPQFAVRAIRQWWRSKGEKRYPNAKGILIEADAGGSNGCRPRLWKIELQRWANEDGLDITVCHYPRGASKWNPIEHRLFSPISRNWAGHPLRSLDVMLGFIRGVTTNGGLKVGAALDQRKYQKGMQISKHEMAALNIHRHKTCPDWNYTIKPQENTQLVFG